MDSENDDQVTAIGSKCLTVSMKAQAMHTIPDPKSRLLQGQQIAWVPMQITRKDVRRQLAHLYADESGAITLVNAVALAFCVLLIVFAVNVNHVVDDKAELQVAADSVAESSSLVMARSMNALTSANHVIGELTAFIIVHEAIGGEWLDEEKRAEDQREYDKAFHNDRDIVGDLNQANSSLDRWKKAAKTKGALVFGYETIRQEKGVFAGATILASKIELKELLVWCYRIKLTARLMQLYGVFPPVKVAGLALERGMDLWEGKLLQEYVALNALHKVAFETSPIKAEIRKTLPHVKKYTRDVVKKAPEACHQTARLVAEQYGYVGTVFPRKPELPVQIDPNAKALTLIRQPSLRTRPLTGQAHSGSSGDRYASNETERVDITRDQVLKVTQLARATFPWVAFHRQPIWDVLDSALFYFSDAGDYYKHYSDAYAKRIVNDLQLKNDMGLYVLKGYSAPDKGYALWLENGRAEELFSIVGVVAEEPPNLTGIQAGFRQQHRQGRIAMAQATFYNANNNPRNSEKIDLTYKRISPNSQPAVGMDTLNWQSPVTELVAKTDDGGHPAHEYPQVHLNWQAKLTPVTTRQIQRLRNGLRERRFQSVLQQLANPYPKTLLGR